MPGVETMYLIQLGFYSMIPIGMYRSTSFMSLAGMRYASGWNPLFSELSIIKISNNYSLLYFQADFISNVNLMVIAILVCPIVAFALYFLSKASNNYKHKPRFLKYSKSFLL